MRQLRQLPVPVRELPRQVQRAQGRDFFRHVVDHAFDLLALGRRNPFQPEARLRNAHVLQHALEQLEAAQHLVVALGVVAVVRMAAADEHPVGPPGERLQNELRIHPPRAHQPDRARVRRILHPRHARQVRRRVRAPVAEKRHDARRPGAVA